MYYLIKIQETLGTFQQNPGSKNSFVKSKQI